MDFNKPQTTLITCNRGLADVLRREVESLGFAINSMQKSSVTITASMHDAMRLNLMLRTALSVQHELVGFSCDSPDDLYAATRSIAWETIIRPDGYVHVTSHVDHPSVNHSLYPSLRIKDAIVDRLMDVHGRRPDAGSDADRGVVVSAYWRNDLCRVYLNTTGRRLSDRTYRKRPGSAPLQETLAAAMLITAGYDGSQSLVLPMCGSGTLAIEAALIAQHRPPGLLRSNYSFTHVIGFDPDAWKTLRIETRKLSHKSPRVTAPIVASDLDADIVEAARHNARTAGVDHLIDFHICDLADTPVPVLHDDDNASGIVMLNPPYGQRLGDESQLHGLYSRIGDFFKQRCTGYRGFVFTANRDLAGHVGLKARRRHVFFHAGLDCRLLEYELYRGSRRPERTATPQ